MSTQPTARTARDGAGIGALLRWARSELAGLGAVANADADELLRSVAGVDRATAYAHPERALDAPTVTAFRAAVARRRAGEPVAYITGRRGFHALELAVGPAVLVPRPESEILVDEVLAMAPPAAFTVLDLGAGSGALGLAIAAARRDARVTGADSSAAALGLARANARALGLDVRFIESDWFAALGAERYDFIVCNPPYVRRGDPHLAALGFEPMLALDGGRDGLDAIRCVLRDARRHLAAGGRLLLEHGFDQAAAVARIAAAASLGVLRVVRDLAGHERVSVLGAS